jgi:hypothetical protein
LPTFVSFLQVPTFSVLFQIHFRNTSDEFEINWFVILFNSTKFIAASSDVRLHWCWGRSPLGELTGASGHHGHAKSSVDNHGHGCGVPP